MLERAADQVCAAIERIGLARQEQHPGRYHDRLTPLIDAVKNNGRGIQRIADSIDGATKAWRENDLLYEALHQIIDMGDERPMRDARTVAERAIGRVTPEVPGDD